MATRNLEQLKTFAEHLSFGATAPEAAEAAGYPQQSRKTFAANARKRAQRPDVRHMVAELRAGNFASKLVTRDLLLAKLYQYIYPDLPRKLLKPADQLGAMRLAAQITGELVEKVAPTTPDGQSPYAPTQIVRLIVDPRDTDSPSLPPAA